ncbi:MAG: hypothetical protein ACOYOE_12535 [Chlorobium sp.]
MLLIMKEKTIATLARKMANIGIIFMIPRLPQHGEAQKKQFRKKVIRHISKRNMWLRLGHYATEVEIDQLKRELEL